MSRLLWVAFCLCLVAAPCAAAGNLPFPPAAAVDEAALAQEMPRLAAALLGDYRESDRATYLDNAFRLQIVAGRYDDALQSLEALRALRADNPSRTLRVGMLQYEIYDRARIIARDNHAPFAAALSRAFHAMVDPMDDQTAALVLRALNVQNYGGLSLIIDLSALREAVKRDLSKQKGKRAIAIDDALVLARDYQIEETYRSIAPFAAALVAQDDRRRYIVEPEVPVKTPDGATVCAFVVRPRGISKPLTTLMEFSIYADLPSSMSEARRDAANGYASVKGFTRGKLCSPGQPVPVEHDGADADALIAWIARQPWSDGRVGMYGASYDGFTSWAAAKHRPKALKALMTAVNFAPGIDVPMEGNVVQTFSYYWPLYTTSNKTVAGAAFEDQAHWSRLFRKWYVSGRAYRDLDKLEGWPNPVWDRWMDHPSYDSYWQNAIPYGREFADIDIPTLITTGYYDGGEIGALYYFQQHAKYRPSADAYLVVGPYDHHTGNHGTVDVTGDDDAVLNGYRLDPAAHVDFGDLRYQWFDYVFRNGDRPSALKDRVNFEVMGADLWRHVPSLAAMADETRAFYLAPTRTRDVFRLATQMPADGTPIPLTVDMSDRKDVDRVAPGGNIVDTAIDTWNGLAFVSDPVQGPFELDGLFKGHLDFVASKKDFDFVVQLYELTADGKYVELSWYMARASYVADRTRRQLLVPNQRQTLDFTSGRLAARKFASGSRLVVVLSVIRQPEIEINYGSGKEVSRETIADAGAPLRIRLFNDSYIGVPLRRAQ